MVFRKTKVIFGFPDVQYPPVPILSKIKETGNFDRFLRYLPVFQNGCEYRESYFFEKLRGGVSLVIFSIRGRLSPHIEAK